MLCGNDADFAVSPPSRVTSASNVSVSGSAKDGAEERFASLALPCPPCGSSFTFESELRQIVSLRCQDVVPEALRNRVAEALRRELEGR